MSQKKRKIRQRLVQQSANNTVEVVSPERGLGIVQIIKENWKFLLIILVGIFTVNFNALNANFVSDDYASITQNTQIYDFKTMLNSFNSTSISTYMLGNIAGISDPMMYHLFSVVLLGVICIIAFVVVYKVYNLQIALLAISIFAFHPIHVEAVTWISGKPYLFIAFYVLLSFLFFIRFRDTGKKIFLFISAIAFILGFLTDNPRPFSIFIIIFLYILSTGIKGYKKYLKYIPYALGVAIVCLIVAWPHILHRIDAVNGGYNASESLFYDPFFQYPTGLAKYFQLLFLPVDLTLYHTMYVFPVWLNWAILLSYLSLIIYFFIKDRRYFFALSIIFAAILPSMMPIKVSWLVAERYMFLGSLGFCIFMALILNDLQSRIKHIVPSIMVVILVFFCVRTFFRNIDWQTNHNLWVNTCQVSPNSHNAWNNIGDDYDKLKQYDNAIKGFTQSTLIKNNYADAYHNRANILFKIGRLDLARDSYMTALTYTPELYQTYLSLINIDLMEKKMDLALSDAQKALSLQPNDSTANYVLAVVYVQRNEKEKAIPILENILRVYPDNKQVKDALIQLKSTT
jgi:protein O-mannosyl-transferase